METVAFVRRARDYRIEYLKPDGTFTSSEKLPFPWTRMDQDDKQRYVDSLKIVQTKSAKDNFVMQMIAWVEFAEQAVSGCVCVAPPISSSLRPFRRIGSYRKARSSRLIMCMRVRQHCLA